MYSFNLLLFAKQVGGWYLNLYLLFCVYSKLYILQVVSLWMQMLGQILIMFGSNPNYVLMSIMTAKTLLKVGCRWCNGGGDYIRAWNDYWLHSDFLVSQGITTSLMLSCVCVICLLHVRSCEIKLKFMNILIIQMLQMFSGSPWSDCLLEWKVEFKSSSER